MKLKEFRPFLDEVVDGYGIEVEVEGVNLPQLNNGYWSTHEDGSLRGEAHEYVTKGAVAFENIGKALKSLNNSFERKGSVLNLSFRTSVHVHMNVREIDVNKIGAIIYTYYLYEELLVQFCGADRIGNRFCLRLRDSEEIVTTVINAFKDDFKRLDPNQLKYSALNLAPIRSYGSLEFRAMRGTVDVETLTTWISLLNCLKNIPFNTAKEVFEYVNEHGYEKLSETVFGEWFRFIEFEGWKQEVVRNTSLAIEIPYRLKEIKKKEPIIGDPLKYKIEAAINQMEQFLDQPRMVRANPPPLRVFVDPIDLQEVPYDEEEEF